MFGRIRMKANKAFRKFFSLSTWRKITLYLLLFCLGTASILTLAFYEPWRYLTFARSSDLILPKDPHSYPRLMIIESPQIDTTKYQALIQSDLPPLYTNLPSDLPKEVIEYVEKRNNYIRQLRNKNTHLSQESTDTMTINELLPYEFNGKEGFFAFIQKERSNEITLFDASFNEIYNIKTPISSNKNIVSTKFQDRFWTFHYSFGSASATVSCKEVIYQNEPTINSLLIGSRYDDFEIDPFSIMKIASKGTNPRIKTHISHPKGYFFYSLTMLYDHLPNPVQEKISFAFYFLFFFFNSILSFLLFTILTLFLSYIVITLAQRRHSHGN
jgi:hypothetical protein